MDIAFCINTLALTGLGPTLSSLTRNVSDSSKLKIWFLCAEISEYHKETITELLNREGFNGRHVFIDFNPVEEFGGFRSLHGDWTAYGRLLIPELVSVERVLYLDADLVVEVDVLDLDEFDLKGNALAAVSSNSITYALDKSFLNGVLGIKLAARHFNSGILILDLLKWRAEKYKEQCLQIARKYPNELISHDQTLLNAVFHGKFTRLPKEFNRAWYVHSPKPEKEEKMILHFLGSPKPWDIGAKLFHKGYETWALYLNDYWKLQYGEFSLTTLQRAWNVRKSYVRVLKKGLNSKIV